eukprot:2903277-Rhodomonas_salina.1
MDSSRCVSGRGREGCGGERGGGPDVFAAESDPVKFRLGVACPELRGPRPHQHLPQRCQRYLVPAQQPPTLRHRLLQDLNEHRNADLKCGLRSGSLRGLGGVEQQRRRGLWSRRGVALSGARHL